MMIIIIWWEQNSTFLKLHFLGHYLLFKLKSRSTLVEGALGRALWEIESLNLQSLNLHLATVSVSYPSFFHQLLSFSVVSFSLLLTQSHDLLLALASFFTYLSCLSWICFPSQGLDVEGRRKKVAISAWNLHMSYALQSSNTANSYPTKLEKNHTKSLFTRHSVYKPPLDNYQLAHKLYCLLSQLVLIRCYHREVFQ